MRTSLAQQRRPLHVAPACGQLARPRAAARRSVERAHGDAAGSHGDSSSTSTSSTSSLGQPSTPAPAAAPAADAATAGGSAAAVPPPQLPLGADGADSGSARGTPAAALTGWGSAQPQDLQSLDTQEGAALRYALVAAVKLCLGCLVLWQPQRCAAVLLAGAAPSGLEVCLARLMGAALVFRACLAAALRSAALRGRLHSTTCQRVMLGCLLPGVSHYLAFKQLVAGSAATYWPGLLVIFPLLLGGEFFAHLTAFEVYHPHFFVKLLWPVAFGLVATQLMPPLPAVELPHAVGPVTAGTAVLLGRRMRSVWQGLSRLLARVVPAFFRNRASTQAFNRLLPEAGGTLNDTVVRLVDFVLPQRPLAWGYFFMMLGCFGAMLNAHRPGLLFAGQVTPLGSLLRLSASGGFLAAAFAADALKTAADRRHLSLPENRHINLCLAGLEVLLAACLAAGLATGAVPPRPYTQLRLASSVVSAAFCLSVWWASTREAERRGWPTEPSVSSVDCAAAADAEAASQHAWASGGAVVAVTLLTAVI